MTAAGAVAQEFATLVTRQTPIDPNEQFVSTTYAAECRVCGWSGRRWWEAGARQRATTDCALHDQIEHGTAT